MMRLFKRKDYIAVCGNTEDLKGMRVLDIKKRTVDIMSTSTELIKHLAEIDLKDLGFISKSTIAYAKRRKLSYVLEQVRE